MQKPKPIHCPRCKTKVATFDGKRTANIVARCRKCNKRIVYHIHSGEIEVKEIPPRTTSSGITFC